MKTQATPAKTLAVGTVTLMLLALGTSAQAASVYWDGANQGDVNNVKIGAGLGGAGNWDTSTLNWWDGASDSDTAWNNASNDTAVFWGTAATVTILTPVTVGGLTFNTTGYILSNGANTLTLGAGDVHHAQQHYHRHDQWDLGLRLGQRHALGRRVWRGDGGHFYLRLNTNTGWSGTTTLNNGITLRFENQNKVLANTTGITFNGGSIHIFGSSGVGGQVNNPRINDNAPVTANGGTFTYHTMQDTDNWNERIGSVALAGGQFNFVEDFDKGTLHQTVYLGGSGFGAAPGLTHAGAAAATFSAPTAPQLFNTFNVYNVTQTPAGEIIGPWATTGTAAAQQTDYAVYDASGNVLPATNTIGAATTDDSAWGTTWAAINNYNFANGVAGLTLSQTRNINALLHTGGAETLTVATGANLGTLGILNGVAGTFTIAATGSGALTLPTTAADNLYVTTGSGPITIGAPINDNTGALTLVKSGTGGTLTLSSTAGAYSGGTVINAGTVSIADDLNLGETSGGITFNGSSTLEMTAGVTSARTIAINNGALATLSGNSACSFSGAITGTGGLTKRGAGTLTLSGANTYMGPTIVSTGTLRLTRVDCLSTGTDVYLYTGVICNLDFSGRQIVRSLHINDVAMPAGTYGENAALPDFFDGTGYLVVPAPPRPSPTGTLLIVK